MFGKIHAPVHLSPEELDDYLERGWFRMGQTIFTCNILRFNKEFYSSIWLRLLLNEYKSDQNYLKLKKLNAGFKIKIQPASITFEKEILYSKYKTGIQFEAAESLNSLLLEPNEPSIYDTWEVCLYDQNRLIGVGFFDIGEKSAAGIVSFYDPEYKKHSLGKYLIYNKIEFCKEKGLQFFYPGYFTPNYSIFDYKLGIGNAFLEFLDIKSNHWTALNQFSNENILIDLYRSKITEVENIFSSFSIPTTRLKYEYYNANTIEHLKDLELFDFPEFLFVHIPQSTNYVPILYYDILSENLKVVRCISCYREENFIGNGEWYGDHLMKIAEEIVSFKQAKSVVHWFITTLEKQV